MILIGNMCDPRLEVAAYGIVEANNIADEKRRLIGRPFIAPVIKYPLMGRQEEPAGIPLLHQMGTLVQIK